MSDPFLNALGAFLLFTLPSLSVWAPIFAFAYSRRNFGGSDRNYALACLVTSIGTAALVAIVGLIEHLYRS